MSLGRSREPYGIFQEERGTAPYRLRGRYSERQGFVRETRGQDARRKSRVLRTTRYTFDGSDEDPSCLRHVTPFSLSVGP